MGHGFKKICVLNVWIENTDRYKLPSVWLSNHYLFFSEHAIEISLTPSYNGFGKNNCHYTKNEVFN